MTPLAFRTFTKCLLHAFFGNTRFHFPWGPMSFCADLSVSVSTVCVCVCVCPVHLHSLAVVCTSHGTLHVNCVKHCVKYRKSKKIILEICPNIVIRTNPCREPPASATISRTLLKFRLDFAGTSPKKHVPTWCCHQTTNYCVPNQGRRHCVRCDTAGSSLNVCDYGKIPGDAI